MKLITCVLALLVTAEAFQFHKVDSDQYAIDKEYQKEPFEYGITDIR